MTRMTLDERELRKALAALGSELEWSGEVRIVLIGGAAGLLTGQLLLHRTSDCDIVQHLPQAAWSAMQRAARRVAQELGIAPDWLNADVRGLAHRLPEGWEARASEVGCFGAVTVMAIGREDLIAMKFIAGRQQDREALAELGVTVREAAFVRRYLQRLAERHPQEAGQVRDALELLEYGGLIHDA